VAANYGLKTARAFRKNRKREQRRRCPLCGGAWRLEKPLHRLFDFKCDMCRLVSNLAWDVR
jgi:predicted  nucleic acid-binding Zn ribbon protein